MPRLDSQKAFRTWQRPTFCYLCGDPLDDGTVTNDDHCPPIKLFLPEDRHNYPLLLKVHKRCNSNWSAADEVLATIYAKLHGTVEVSETTRRGPDFHEVRNEQGIFQGISGFPIRPFATRVIRCVHALLYGEWLPTTTPNDIHIPVPEKDPISNRPKMHLMQSYAFADALCNAQKSDSYDSIVAYGGKFKYVTTWSQFDDGGEPICLFAFDVYQLHKLGIVIDQFPKTIIGFYQRNPPPTATSISASKVHNTDAEILYPILI